MNPSLPSLILPLCKESPLNPLIASTLFSNEETSSIVSLDFHLILPLDTSQILARPNIRHLILASLVQLWDLPKIRYFLLRRTIRIEQQYESTFGRSSRPEFSRIRSIKSPIWIRTPFIGGGWFTDIRV